MSFISVFDVLGPNMIGPSSSHTAGAAAIALLARKMMNRELVRADFTLYGSFAQKNVDSPIFLPSMTGRPRSIPTPSTSGWKTSRGTSSQYGANPSEAGRCASHGSTRWK